MAIVPNNILTVQIPDGYIESTQEKGEYKDVEVKKHTADPIRSLEDIDRISEYLLSEERYRDYMLFVVGINVGLRASDLRLLKFGDFFTEKDGQYFWRERFYIREKKTENTRKSSKKPREIFINEAVRDAVMLYLQKIDRKVELNDYLFTPDKKSGHNDLKPITVRSIERILGQISTDLNLGLHISSHSLRKTFGYHQMMMDYSEQKLILLQHMFGHSNRLLTMLYIGITEEDVSEAYNNLNLAGKNCYSKEKYVQASPFYTTSVGLLA